MWESDLYFCLFYNMLIILHYCLSFQGDGKWEKQKKKVFHVFRVRYISPWYTWFLKYYQRGIKKQTRWDILGTVLFIYVCLCGKSTSGECCWSIKIIRLFSYVSIALSLTFSGLTTATYSCSPRHQRVVVLCMKKPVFPKLLCTLCHATLVCSSMRFSANSYPLAQYCKYNIMQLNRMAWHNKAKQYILYALAN